MKKTSFFILANLVAMYAFADLKVRYVDINDFAVEPVQDAFKIIQDIESIQGIDEKITDKRKFIEDLKKDREAVHYLFIVKNKLDICGIFIGMLNKEEIEIQNELCGFADDFEKSDELEAFQEYFEEYTLASSKVEFVFIDQKYRQQGIATKLLRMFEGLSKKAGCIKCYISYVLGDKVMKKFILKNGYKFAFEDGYEFESEIKYVHYMVKDL